MLGFCVKEIGRHMPRARYSRGTLAKSKTKPQKWMGDWDVYRIVEGVEKRVHRGPKIIRDEHGVEVLAKAPKSEAQRHLDRMIEEDRAPQDQRKRGPETLSTYWPRYCAAMAWSQAMRDNIEGIFTKHVLPAKVNPVLLPRDCATDTPLGEIPLRLLSADVIRACLNDLAAAGRSRSLVGKVKTYLKAVLIEAVEADLIPKSPWRKINMPKCKASAKTALSPEQCKALLAKAVELGKSREHLILRLCLSLGPRRGEVLAIRRNDVEHGRLRIDESACWDAKVKDPKTRDSNAYLPLPETLEIELRSWMTLHPGEPSDFLFPGTKKGQPYRPSNYLRRVLKPLAEKAGVQGVNFQTLRRTTATRGQRHGSVKDIQGVLRHSTPQMTVGVYMQEIPDGVRQAVQGIDDELMGGRVQ